jgi:hypothetical protein
MDEHFQRVRDLNLIQLKWLQEHCNRLTLESYRAWMHPLSIQDRLAELETQINELDASLRSSTH